MKTNRFPGRLWFQVIFFGLIGQIAWVVENMYFATLCQDIFGNTGRPDLSYIVTTLMVILSAVTATVTTFIAGAASDRRGKRKSFIAVGYILWGFTIMIFAVIPMKPDTGMLFWTGLMLVAFDCIMTAAGSTSNDAAFNAWVADNTNPGNRGRVNAVLSMLPVFAVVVVFIGLGGFYSAENESNALFFIILGCIPTLAGILALFTVKDSGSICPSSNPASLKDTLYGFRRNVIRENRMMYICLGAYCLIAVSQQTFFSYLINFMIKTLGYGDGFVIPMAVVIVGAAAVTGVLGILYDRLGRRHFFLPLTVLAAAGTFSFFMLGSIPAQARDAVVYAGGIIMMGAILSLTGALQSAFQDYIPAGCEGRFQGIRMCFT
ncbi:MAG: hypothetical protein CW338_04685, partial [Clostridiales bacterium]|nr:hypothetical protein [Clostridiales bacterium]